MRSCDIINYIMIAKQKLRNLLPLFLVKSNSNNKFNLFMIFKLHFMYFYRGFFFSTFGSRGWRSPTAVPPWQRAWDAQCFETYEKTFFWFLVFEKLSILYSKYFENWTQCFKIQCSETYAVILSILIILSNLYWFFTLTSFGKSFFVCIKTYLFKLFNWLIHRFVNKPRATLGRGADLIFLIAFF